MTLRSSISEAEPHLHSGVRTKHRLYLLNRDLTLFTASTTAAHSPTTWTTIAVTGRRSVPQTPCFWLEQFDIPQTGNARFRVTGFNQFMEPVRETTPWVGFDAKINNFFWLASVFNYVSAVEYQIDSAGLASTNLSLGVFPNPQRTEDGSNSHKWGDNLGIGLPLKVGAIPRQITGNNVETAEFQVLNLDVFNRTTDVIWRIGDNLIVGRNVASFPVERNKVAITSWASVINEAGAAPAYAVTDTLQVGISLHTMLTKISGNRLNDV